MLPLTPPALHNFRAAQGWLELGNLAEATLELARIEETWQSHPDVLELRWDLLAHEKKWAAALAVAEQLVAAVPERCSGWIHRSFSLHELKRTQEALDLLQPAAGQFPKVSTIPYNLACYACQLGRLDDARTWLAQAQRLGGRDRILAMARQDSDLASLRPELG